MRLTTLRKNDGGYDVVTTNGDVVGHVSREPDETWSYAPWVIEGDRSKAFGGVGGLQRRRRGYATRAAAHREIEVMNSGAILAALPTKEAP